MKKQAFLLLLLLTPLFGDDRLQYTLIKNSYWFSTYFEMVCPDDYEGRVTKNSISVRNFYKYYNADGEYKGQGITRLASLGPLYKWGCDIDIYDEYDKKIGVIYGKLWSTAKAKFEMYDANRDLVAIAYFGFNRDGFSLMKPGNVEALIGYMKITPNEDLEVLVYNRKHIDERLIKIYSAFVSDFQKAF